ISDKKIGHSSDGTTLDYYDPDVVQVTDYYPFGMVSRFNYLGNLFLGYRYSFNGKENDGDAKGDGNQQDYGARIYDPRLGRFLSVDPITNQYPFLTPYQFASNSPVAGSDLDGLEFFPRFKQNDPWSLTTWSIVKTYHHSTVDKVLSGSVHGAANTISGTINFFRTEAWKPSTWSSMGQFFEESVLSMSSVKVANTPMIDAVNDEFIDKVIYGDAYTRSEYISGFATGMAIGYFSDKGLSKILGGSSKVAQGAFVRRFFIKAAQSIEEHLSQARFLNLSGTIDAGNQIMVNRIRAIATGELKATQVDVNFINHELTESALMKKGLSYEEAHVKALETHGIPNDKNAANKIYTPEALDASNKEMEREYSGKKNKP
ncbi:MAG TPA: RHS repeat-associated core domain-containing protein, partial [Chitinophagaceae bacterium]|nr:RHS repeat-associated core domain-containing protein [Chitinophagaceae bacterium]